MALNDAVPSSATDVFKRNAEDADKLLNTTANVVNRVGSILESFPSSTGRASDAADAAQVAIQADVDAAEAAKVAALASYTQWNSRGDWATATAYAKGDIWNNTVTSTWYLVLNAYTSGATVNNDISGPNVTVLQGEKYNTFEGLSDAVAFITAHPELFPENSALSTSSNKTPFECTASGIPYPDGGGADYVVSSGLIVDGENVVLAGTKQINRIKNVIKSVIQGEAAPIYSVEITEQINESTDRRIIAIISGVLYADSSTTLYSSTDMGETWTAVRSNAGIGRGYKMLSCSDGEILFINGGRAVYKTTGWATDKATASFNIVLTFPLNTSVLRWGLEGNGTKFIATHYEGGGGGATRADIRYVYISLDSGDTWSLVWDSVAKFTAPVANTSHLHGVCYDEANDRFWISEGHQDLGLYYSETDGATWTSLSAPGLYSGSAPTTLTPTPYGIVAGTDEFPNGIHLIKGDAASTLSVDVAYVHRSQGLGTILQADAAVTDPDTGMVYIAARGHGSPATSVIMSSNGSTASLVYESDSADPIANLAVKDGVLIAHQTTTPYRIIRAKVSTVGSKQPLVNAGNLLTSNIVPNLSLAIGNNSNAGGLGSISLGLNTEVNMVGGDSGTAIGNSAKIESGQRNVAVGASTELLGTTTLSTVVGSSVELTDVSAVVVVGDNASTTKSNTVVVGKDATSLGSASTTVGYSADTTAGNAVAVGANSLAALLSTAVGSGAVADVTGGVAVGCSTSLIGNNSTVIGYDATTTGGSSLAAGKSAVASGTSSAVGASTTATGANSTAAGYNASALSTNTVALGASATTSAGIVDATALGAGSSADHASSVALGKSTATQRINSVCVGNRDIESTKAGGAIFLKSPDGTLYTLTIANGGTLSITAA